MAITRREAAQAAGFRPLTSAEARARGLTPGGTGRKYVSTKIKKVTASTPLFTRRAIEEPLLATTFEGVAKQNELRRLVYRIPQPVGGVGGTRYAWALENYAYTHGITRGEARSSLEFREAYRWLKNGTKYKNKERPSINEKNLTRALERLGLRDPSWSWAVGDTPDGAGYAHQAQMVNALLADGDDA